MSIRTLRQQWLHGVVLPAAALVIGLSTAQGANIAQAPLYLTQSVTPMIMLAVSVDHQLFKKAYSDYSDIDDDGSVETTYDDSYDYHGYFDNTKCYDYNSGNARFQPNTNTPGGTNNHDCTGDQWSGNFLNWATMTRVDLVRKVLYGGKRHVDSATETVLERALLPTDVHAFAKVFSSENMQSYTPFSSSTLSFCNTTLASGLSQDVDTSTYPPKVRIATGAYPRWAADEVHQCQVGTDNAPSSTVADRNVLVQVCASGNMEGNCRTYYDDSNDTLAYKPAGILQEYGEDGSLRFGLISGSYDNNDAGGVLRRTIGQLAGNATASENEIDLIDGTFTGNDGIISTLNKIRINEWDYGSHVYDDCDAAGISKSKFLTGSEPQRQCSNWGNPVGEIYLEALRYFCGEPSANGDYATSSDPLGLAQATWSDPMPTDEWCAPLKVVLISSSDNSFDTDELTSIPTELGNIDTATDDVGTNEGLSASDSVFIGSNGTITDDMCTAKGYTGLSNLSGICPTAPFLEGGYDVAGLAFKAHTTDLRDDRQNDNTLDQSQTVDTFFVALSQDLPDFRFEIGDSEVAIVPTAGANSDADAALGDSGWRVGSMADLIIRETAAGYIRFLVLWEDSPWGNDYDKDGINQIAICVGAECANHDDDDDGATDDNYDSDGDGTNDATVGASEVRVTNRVVNGASDHAVRFGYVISGTDNDGRFSNVLMPGFQHGNALDSNNDPIAIRPTDGCCPGWSDPDVQVFATGEEGAGIMLKRPMFYAAKYGGFEDEDGSDTPNEQDEWDADGDGLPDTYFRSDNPALLGERLTAFFSSVARQSSSSSVVTNSVTLEAGTRIYQAQFDSGDWTGTVKSFPIGASGEIGEAEWDAAEVLEELDFNTDREILSWDPTGGASGDGQGIPFLWGDLNTTQQTYLNDNPETAVTDDDGQGSARLDYVRGDTGGEINNGGDFRNRERVMGDIINSTPYYVGAIPPFNYSSSFADSGYATFRSNIAALNSDAGRTPMLYVGGNDGMLHGIKAETGEELVAYVPNEAIPELNRLTDPDYDHQYYVDGSPTVGDAYDTFPACSGDSCWRSILVGGLNAGGQAIYALDVTNPASFSESNAGSLVLWEIKRTTAVNSDFEDLGYTFSRPAIVRLNDGNWAVVFGNGYHSANGKAVLYIVDLATGDLIKKLDTEVGSAASPNGMSTSAPIDTDHDRIVDYIYAGDLYGNMWKFDLSSTNSSQWGSAFSHGGSPTPLFTALNNNGDRQPITARPEVGRHPEGGTGYVLYFGTGKFFEIGDNTTVGADMQSFYAVWDPDDGTNGLTRNNLMEQAILAEFEETFTNSDGESYTYDVRVTSDNTISWNDPDVAGADHFGWYMDLIDPAGSNPGERVIYPGILRGGRIIFTTTLPSSEPCDFGGTGWLMEVDAGSGGRLDTTPWDLNRDSYFNEQESVEADLDDDGSADEASYTVAGKRSKVGLIQRPAIIGAGETEYKYASGSRNAEIEMTVESSSQAGKGRTSWRQLK